MQDEHYTFDFWIFRIFSTLRIFSQGSITASFQSLFSDFFSHMMMMLGNSLIHLKCDPVSGIIRLGSHKIPSEVTPIVSPSLFIFIRKRCLMMNNPTRTISSHSASSLEFLTFSWAQSLKDQGLYLLWDGMKIDVTFYDLMIFPYSLYAAPSLTPRAD